MPSITKRVTFIAKEGCEEEMKRLLTAMVEPSKAEPGVIFYDIFQCTENRRKFYAVESWESEEALAGHAKTEHYAVYKSSYEPYCEDKYTEHLEILG
jgi:quinol monooxygenase YgiN